MSGQRHSPLTSHRFWGSIDPQSRAHPGLVAPLRQAPTPTTAVFQIYEPIDSWGAPFGISAKEFTAALLALDEGVGTIELRINSPGGEAFEAMAIINALRAHSARVVAFVDGIAASAAADIAISSDELTMLTGSQLMVHRSWGIELGTTDDLASYAVMLANLDDAQADLMVAKAGGTRAEWLDAMTPGTWYSAESAVEAGLADRATDAKAAADDMAPAARFDLSILPELDTARTPFAPAARLTCRCGPLGSDISGEPAMQHKDECPAAPELPAEPQGDPSTNPKGAAVMAELKDGLRERFGFAEDASDDAILAAIDGARDPDASDEAIAKSRGLSADQVKAALDGAKAGLVTVSGVMLDELKAQAALGAQARGKQLADERDETIEAARAQGKISAERVTAWATAWDKDPEGTKADLASLEVRFPVAKASGYLGDGSDHGPEAHAEEDKAIESDMRGAVSV